MITLKDIRKTFFAGQPNEVKALKGITLDIPEGSFTLLTGANGSGKSTILKVIAGSLAPDTGTVTIDGEAYMGVPEHARAPLIARLFQDPLAGTSPDLSIVENFRLGYLRGSRKGLVQGINRTFRSMVADRIRMLGMGLENKLDQDMGSLSGGQRQALTLLMATMADCKVLLMDEPTSALDPRSSEIVMEQAEAIIREKNLTAILVTHRLKDCLHYGDRVVHLSEGEIAYDVRGDQKKSLTLDKILSWF